MEIEIEPRNTNGQFKAGHPGFKKKGDVHFIAREIRGKVADFLNKRADQLDETWDKLKDNERARLFVELMSYLVPKQKELTINETPVERGIIHYEKLSEQTLKEILENTNLHENEN